MNKLQEWLRNLGFEETKSDILYNLTPDELIEESIKNEEGQIASTGALCCDTGVFTGRSPKDRYIVRDSITDYSVDWGEINKPIEKKYFDILFNKVISKAKETKLYIRDSYVCSDPSYRTNIRVISTKAWHNLFCHHLFLRPRDKEEFIPEYTILNIPEAVADPTTDGVPSENFVIINFTRKIIIIGGTEYSGEMKKGIFSVLNFILPQKNILTMHCSANVDDKDNSCIFFGLSGTGKTTLSSDESRKLIGDDEHGWSDDGIFNFEGGCYAKTINLSKEFEPQIYSAIRHYTILENTSYIPGTRKVDYNNSSKTENTRAAYPLEHIDNRTNRATSPHPKNIIFLTCDAYGILPPVSKLDRTQAMYHFLSGYTAKVAGTERGITEPKATFSACFGEAFIPLAPIVYAELLGNKIDKYNINTWLVNTGWNGGPYGEGRRIEINVSRKIIENIISDKLQGVLYSRDNDFNLCIPTSFPQIDDHILDPINTWSNKDNYKKMSKELIEKFHQNFERFMPIADHILPGGPK